MWSGPRAVSGQCCCSPAGAVLVEDPRYTISRHRGCARGPQRGVRRCPRRAIASAALPDTPASRRAPAPAPPRAPPPPSSPVRATVRLPAGAEQPSQGVARATAFRGAAVATDVASQRLGLRAAHLRAVSPLSRYLAKRWHQRLVLGGALLDSHVDGNLMAAEIQDAFATIDDVRAACDAKVRCVHSNRQSNRIVLRALVPPHGPCSPAAPARPAPTGREHCALGGCGGVRAREALAQHHSLGGARGRRLPSIHVVDVLKLGGADPTWPRLHPREDGRPDGLRGGRVMPLGSTP